MEQDTRVLVIEDDDAAREALCEYLRSAGFVPRPVRSGAEALAAAETEPPDAVLLDLVIPEPDGFEVLRRLHGRDPALPIVVMSGISEAEYGRARDAARGGGLPAEALRGPRARPRAAPGPRSPRAPPGRRSAAATPRARRRRRRRARADALRLRWSGSGPSRIASPTPTCRCCSWARAASARTSSPGTSTPRAGARRTPFVKINCAALPGELLESELFGHEKGAFTGAHAEKPGKFELAHEGTIFLDEIGEMDPRLQAKLLQVLQDEEFYRVGGQAAGARRRARRRRDQPQPRGRDPAGHVPRGPLLPAQRGDHPRPAAPRAQGGDRARWCATSSTKYRRPVPRRSRGGPGRGDGAVPRPRLARATCASSRTWSAGSSCCGIPRWCSASSGRARARALRCRRRARTRPRRPDAPRDALRGRAAQGRRRGAPRGSPSARRSSARSCRTGWNKRKAAKRLQISYKALLYKIKDCEIVDPRNAAIPE